MATTYYEIPLNPNAQKFFVTLVGVQYLFVVMWRGVWVLDIYTAAGVALVQCIPLITGVDLLEPYPDLAVGGALYAMTDGDTGTPPTYANLGTTGHLYFGVTA